MKRMSMKRARRLAPASPTRYDGDGKILQPRTLVGPFRRWARKEYADWGGLSPKLDRIVNGGGR